MFLHANEKRLRSQKTEQIVKLLGTFYGGNYDAVNEFAEMVREIGQSDSSDLPEMSLIT